MENESVTAPDVNDRIRKYRKHYNETDFWKKLNALSGSTLRQMLKRLLLLRELLFDANTPHLTRLTIVACLGYVITPFDAIPDFLVGIGYLDDFAIMGLVLGKIESLATDDIKQRVKDRMGEPLEAQPTDAEEAV